MSSYVKITTCNECGHQPIKNFPVNPKAAKIIIEKHAFIAYPEGIEIENPQKLTQTQKNFYGRRS